MNPRIRLVGNVLTVALCTVMFLLFLERTVNTGSIYRFYIGLNPELGTAAGVWGILALLGAWRVQDGKGGQW